MRYPIAQFVDAPSPAASVRYDFNDGTTNAVTSLGSDGFSLGVPSLEGDPDGVGVEYGLRALTLPQFVEGPKSAALARQSALAREILRPRNWFHFQLNAFTKPVWFRTYRGDPGDLSFDNVYVENEDGDRVALPDQWLVSISLAAEPFAYGERVTLSTVTINNDPAAATNPMSYVLPQIVGDAPAPLRVELQSLSGDVWPSRLMMVATPLPAGLTATRYWQVGGASDGWTAGTDTGASVANVAFSDGSYRAVTFATTPGMADRLSRSVEIGPLGRWRFLVRVARSDTASQFAYKASVGGFVGDEVPRAVVTTASGYAEWVDLGLFTVPPGLRDMSTVERTISLNFNLAMERLSGTGEARVDVVAAIPVESGDTSARTLSNFTGLYAGGVSAYDGDGEYVQMYLSTGEPTATDLDSSMEGGFSLVHPGAANRLDFFQQVSPPEDGIGGSWAPMSDDVTRQTSATLSYHPRYLWIGGE